MDPNVNVALSKVLKYYRIIPVIQLCKSIEILYKLSFLESRIQVMNKPLEICGYLYQNTNSHLYSITLTYIHYHSITLDSIDYH